MKRVFLALIATVALTANAEVFIFDFNHPESLTPSVAEPAQKEYVSLDGRSFTAGPVMATFTASESGNTHVRIYHSYDAGIDLRLYDGDAVTVSVPENMLLKSIQFTMSLSGNASGSNDINFIPDTGDFVWEDERWTPYTDSTVSIVELTSAMQSRIYIMSVEVEESSYITEVSDAAQNCSYFSICGKPVSELSSPGIYIKISGNIVSKVIIK